MESRRDMVGLTRDLHRAVVALDASKVSNLLAVGAAPSLLVNGTTALHLAVRKPSNVADERLALQIIQMLLDQGGDINVLVSSRTVMSLAGHNSFWQAVLLIAHNKKTDALDNGLYGSALLDAIRFCENEELLQSLVSVLLESGALVNCHNRDDGFTALHWAVRNARPFVLRLLLAKFPDAYLHKSVATELHGKGKTPARMAYQLYLELEQKSHLRPDESILMHRRWECVCAIAEVAYMPIILRSKESYPEQLVKEKDIIFKFVSSLPFGERWQAMLDGQNEAHPLGRLNRTQRKLGVGSTATVDLYKAGEVGMRARGFPRVLERASARMAASQTSLQLFQGVPRVIADYVDSGARSESGSPREGLDESGVGLRKSTRF